MGQGVTTGRSYSGGGVPGGMCLGPQANANPATPHHPRQTAFRRLIGASLVPQAGLARLVPLRTSRHLAFLRAGPGLLLRRRSARARYAWPGAPATVERHRCRLRAHRAHPALLTLPRAFPHSPADQRPAPGKRTAEGPKARRRAIARVSIASREALLVDGAQRVFQLVARSVVELFACARIVDHAHVTDEVELWRRKRGHTQLEQPLEHDTSQRVR